MKGFTFDRGVHFPAKKELSGSSPIEKLEPGDKVYLSVQQHMGAPAVPVVGAGDTVKCAQLVAEAAGGFSSNIFSPVSGEVEGIVRRKNNIGVDTDYIVVVNDREYDTVRLPEIAADRESILSRIFEAGIVGMGGAGFPTAIKVKPKTPVDTLVINGAECEPYLTCDHRVMLEYTEEFVNGVLLLATAIGVKRAVIGIEVNKQDAIDKINDLLKNKGLFIESGGKLRKELASGNCGREGVAVMPLKCKYPQGSEKQLIYACTGRKVPCGGLPSDVGIVVQNVQTAVAVNNAVDENKPLYERVMTVSGGAVRQPKNLLVANGTPYSEILEACGGVTEDVAKLICGGPMMGLTLQDDGGVTTKTEGALVALKKGEADTTQPTPCINCGRCALHCPMHLMPMYIDFYTLAGDYESAVKYGVRNCFECGTCTYVCPAKRTLMQSIKLCKAKLREMKK